jgi:hypothetical protein
MKFFSRRYLLFPTEDDIAKSIEIEARFERCFVMDCAEFSDTRHKLVEKREDQKQLVMKLDSEMAKVEGL